MHASGTLLHVGCGPLHIDATPFGPLGWRELRLDIDPDCSPDLIGSMTDMAAVAAASVDAIFSSHNLEHLEAHAVPIALAAGQSFMAHRTGFNAKALEATLIAAGFARVVVFSRPEAFELWALATREPWPEEALTEAVLSLLPVLPKG